MGVSLKTACMQFFFWRRPGKVWSNLEQFGFHRKLISDFDSMYLSDICCFRDDVADHIGTKTGKGWK